MERAAYTFSEICQRNGICRATLYNLLKQGKGPAVIRMGAYPRVTAQAEAEWHRRMAAEDATAKAAA